MTALDYILKGIEAELQLERELGTRVLEYDRSIVQPRPQPTPQPTPTPPPSPQPSATTYDFVFLHHAPLKPDGIEMMAKIIGALKKTADTAPILFTGDLPRARAYVALGPEALHKWFPKLSGSVGAWLSSDRGEPVLFTHSPERILCFKTVTPAVQQLKREMWQSLKSIYGRIGLQEVTNVR